MSEMLWLSLIVPIIKHDNWNVRGREGVCWPVKSTQSTIDTIRVTMAPAVAAVVTSQGVIPVREMTDAVLLK